MLLRTSGIIHHDEEVPQPRNNKDHNISHITMSYETFCGTVGTTVEGHRWPSIGRRAGMIRGREFFL